MNDEPIQQPEDSVRVSRLSSAPPEPTETDAEDTIREYEERYTPKRRHDLDSDLDAEEDYVPPRRVPSSATVPAPQRSRPRSYSTLRVTDDERLWAAVAHISAWVTFLGGIATIGTIIPVSIFIPLIVYFLFRRKSDFVAFHALQAFVIQLIGTVGAAILLLAGGLVWGVGMVIALLLMVVLVGFVLVPVWALVGLVLLLVALVMPLAMVIFGTIAAVATYNGADYHYPYIARWVDRQLAGGFLNTI